MMRNLENLLSRLEGVNQTKPDSWLACCPAHDDKYPSLSIRETSEGKILVHCFAGCSVHEVADAIGLEISDLFPPRESYGKPERRPFPAMDERHLSPLYYGRYVDDVLLVIDSSKIKITSAESVWALIAERLDGLVVPGKDGDEVAYWVKLASVAGTVDPDPERYFRLNKLVNDVLLERIRVQYLVLPELALPRRWFNRLAHKLSHSGVSLIAGLEYLHHEPPKSALISLAGTATGYVANQIRASLVTDVLGYPAHVIYVQEKVRPALDEEKNLRSIAGKLMVPKGAVRKPIIRHGDFHFGVLICSELTNIDLRQPFRGKVDALFVPEWNKDINSFISLVEASALDIHCFVVQVNNRTYGDCRIRAPYREPFRRDVTRVMGGETDYFVVGKIDIKGLRAFQSNFRSPMIGGIGGLALGSPIICGRRTKPVSGRGFIVSVLVR